MTKLELQQIKLNEIVEQDFGRVAVILEGRDTAGKTGTINELTHYLPTSKYSVSLSSKPNAWDMANWLESWERKLPSDNQIVFFDRSWYSRAMVQYLNGCVRATIPQFSRRSSSMGESATSKVYQTLVVNLEQEQEYRIAKRKSSPLTKWKFSPNDSIALSKYDQMTILKERVFTTLGEWHSIDYNVKSEGRLALITKIVDLLQINQSSS